MDFITELRDYGFSEKEAKVYLALLNLGPATVNEIAEKADLIRTSTYDLLKGLREKGIIASSKKNKVLYFETHNPKQLALILEEKRNRIQKIIPLLSKLKNEMPNNINIELFEGAEGIKTVFREIINTKEPICAYSNNNEMLKLLPYSGPNFVKNRIDAQIPIKLFSEDSPTTKRKFQAKDKKEFRETKIIKGLKDATFNEYIFGDSIAIFGSRQNEPVGLIIKHKEFAHAQKIIFNELWKRIK